MYVGTNVMRRYFAHSSTDTAEFSDLKPGVLSEELHNAMGLRLEEPPPWLFRMRQMGYPPGYRSAIHRDPACAVTALVFS